MQCCEMWMQCVIVDQAVIVGEQVYSADRYCCGECGSYRFGTMGETPIRPLSEWGADCIMQPVPLNETPEEAEAAMERLEAAKTAAGY